MPENQPFDAERVPLDLVDSNPYSCRLSEDPEHVRKIADSIKIEGLMQMPIGRRIDGRVQLAFGHTRLAAFKLLLSETKNPGFETIPVIIRSLDDDEMFRTCVSENLARKDLTPIEEATAMKRYRDEFGKTSEEIGALFHLAGRAVIAFKVNDRKYRIDLPLPDRNNPEFAITDNGRRRTSQDAVYSACEQATRQRWRALALWIKAVLEAAEAGIVTLEDALQTFVMLPNGRTVGEWLGPQIDEVYRTRQMPQLLPGTRADNEVDGQIVERERNNENG